MSVTLAAASPEGVRIEIGGILDEGFDYAKLTSQVRGITVIDLGRIRRVTSFGVAQWQAALHGARPSMLSFVRCPPCMMTQFNIIRQFDCGGSLVSVYLPYLCSSCGAEHRVLYDRRGREGFSLREVPESVRCEACGQDAEFDDVPEVYFEYLMHAPAIPGSPVLDSLIDVSSDVQQ